MHRLAIAVIGGGGLIGQRHCEHVNQSSYSHLCAVVDPTNDAAVVAQRFGAAHYTTVDKLLNSVDKPHAAIICTPNHTHVAVGIQLACAGVHILCEKPIATSSYEAQDLINAADRYGVHLLIGHHRRFNPYLMALKGVVDSGQLGRIIAVNGLWTTVKPAEYFAGANSWRSRKGGGVVLINLIHDLDLFHHLFGPIVSVQAQKTAAQRLGGRHAVEEGAAIILKFESGVVGTFIVSDNVTSPHSFEQGTGENPHLPMTGADVYRVFGSQGTISFPDMTLSTYKGVSVSWNNTLSKSTMMVANADQQPLALQLEHFVRVCKGVEPPLCSGTEGLRALAACEAIVKALDEDVGTVVVEMPLRNPAG